MAPDDVLGRALRESIEAQTTLGAAEREWERLRQKLVAAGSAAAADTFRVSDLGIYAEVLNVEALQAAADALSGARAAMAAATRRLDDAKR
jgi:hypothetical protein